MNNGLRTAALMTGLTVLLVLLGGALGGSTGAGLAFIMAAVSNGVAYWFGDRIVLRRYGANEVGPEDGSRVYRSVQKLVGRADLPMPRVFVIPEKAPNAFATGRNPEHASVAATRGLLDILDDDELDGVMGHELAHVKHRDILTGTVAATLAGAITMVSQMGRYQGMYAGMGGRRGGARTNPLVLILAAMGAPVAAMFLRSSLSRTREFAADDGGAEISRKPEALANALERMQSVARGVPLERATAGHAHLFILSPFLGSGLGQLFSTHPPTEERVRRLRKMAGAGSRGALPGGGLTPPSGTH